MDKKGQQSKQPWLGLLWENVSVLNFNNYSNSISELLLRSSFYSVFWF